MAEAAHTASTGPCPGDHHDHGGAARGPDPRRRPGCRDRLPQPSPTRPSVGRARILSGQGEAIKLGTLYALGHGAVVIALGLAAIAFGALLPDWLDPIMGRIVGFTLVALGLWVLYSVYRYASAGETFRLRSRWMLVFDGIRHGWRLVQARLHGHEHVEPLEMSSYGTGTSFGVGMIHGIGAETGTQVLLIAAVGGASSAGPRRPDAVRLRPRPAHLELRDRLLSSVGFVSSQSREQVYVAIGAVAGIFSLFVGTIFLFGLDGVLPDLGGVLPF